MKTTELHLSAVTRVQVCTDDQGDFLGLGGVTVGGVALRGTARPMTIRVDTPDGWLYTQFKLKATEQLAGGGVRLALTAVGLHVDRGEYMDDYGQTVVWLEPYAESVTDELALVLKPVALELGGRQWQGLAYHFEYASASRQIHRLLTHGSWEIGGRITGNTVLHQGQCNMPVYRGAVETMFTTACLRTLDQYGSPQGNSFQLSPRAGLTQGFDFQFAAAGALFQFWPEFRTIASLLESKAGEDILHVLDEYRFELAGQVATTPKWVLFTPGPLAEHEARDLWWEAREHVYGGLRKHYGVTPTQTIPEIGMRYSTRVDGGTLRMTVGGEEVPSTGVLRAVGDNILPRLAEQGIRRFFPEVMSQSDVTELGMRRKLDGGVHGDLHCSSVCATHRFFPADFWGGIQGWKYMAAKGRALGIEIGAWFAPHFSPRAKIFEEHPEWRMIDVNGFPAGGGYGFQTITVADWNSGIYEWVLNDMKRWQAEGGLDYLFIDSYSNMGMVQMNYTQRMRTNFVAFSRLLADLQKIGIRVFTFESVCAFGGSRFGLADLRGDLLGQNRSVAGQNDYGWWVGEEDMVYNVCMCVAPRKRSDAELEQAMFRSMANGGYLMLEGCVDASHTLAPWWARLNHLHNQALPLMGGPRRLLPGRGGVRWGNPGGDLLWTFTDMALTVPVGGRVEAFDGQAVRELACGSPVTLPAWGVYRVRGAG